MDKFESLEEDIVSKIDGVLESATDKREALTEIESVISDILIYYLAMDGYDYMKLDKKDFKTYLTGLMNELKDQALEYYDEWENEEAFSDEAE
jgi:hypothetical protein